MIRYLSTADIADMFNVGPATVNKWRARYADFPKPDAEIGSVVGWRASRKREFLEWNNSRAGQGARNDLRMTK